MQLHTVLILFVALASGLVGILFLACADRIGRLEARLNAPWGERVLFSLRTGLRGEQDVEQVMNRNVLDRQIVWDGWSRQHPRLVGVALCLLAVWFGSLL